MINIFFNDLNNLISKIYIIDDKTNYILFYEWIFPYISYENKELIKQLINANIHYRAEYYVPIYYKKIKKNFLSKLQRKMEYSIAINSSFEMPVHSFVHFMH